MNEAHLENVIKSKELQNEEENSNGEEKTSEEIIIIDIEGNVTEKANINEVKINEIICMNLRENNTTPMNLDSNKRPQRNKVSEETREHVLHDQNEPPRSRGFVRDSFKSEPVGEPLDYEPYTRNTFLRIVFGLVILMLIVVALFNFLVLQSPEAKNLFSSIWLSLIPGIVLSLGVQYAFACCSCARFPPCSFFVLILGVVGQCLVTVYFTSRFSTEIVVMALAATAITVFVCFCLAFSSFDFTKYMLYLVVVSVALSAVFLIIMVVKFILNVDLRIVYLVLLIVATLVQAVALTMEIQMVLGGRAIELGTNDYAFGAYMIFNSIISLFIDFMLQFDIIDSLL